MTKNKIRMTECISLPGKLAVCILLGTLLLLGVYSLPTERMRENVARSSSIFDYEGTYPQMVNGYKYMQLDNYTDSIMLGAAIYDSPASIVDKAMNNYHMDSDALPSILAMTNYANKVENFNYYTVAYGRYWHGYLVFLKPLLLLFDYADIRIFNFFLQWLLLFINISLFYKNGIEKYLPAFAAAILVLNPLTTALSLQFSSIYYIVQLSSMFMLQYFHKKQSVETKVIGNLFFLSGVMSSYFDFLTYPLTSFGILITLCFILNSIRERKRELHLFCRYLTLWGFGYFGMWMGKWFVGGILLNKNLFADAFKQALFRASSNSTGIGDYTRISVLFDNIKVLMKWPFVVMASVIIIYLLLEMRHMKSGIKNIYRNSASTIAGYSATATLPILWFLLLANHSKEHYWFTYRELSISVFAALSLFIYIKEKCMRERTKENGESNEKI